MGSRQAGRRRFIKEGAALAGLAAAAPAVGAQTLVSGSGRTHVPGGPHGQAEHPLEFGERSRFVRARRIPITQVGHADMHGDPNGYDAMTPMDQLTGTITPADLHYVSQHQNAPEDIDPRKHRLLISGMVDRPLIFTLDELKRLPSVSRIHYIECIANRPNAREQTLNDLHGMVACSEWTGVLLSVLLEEAGVQDGVTWVLGESADKVGLGTNIPFPKAMDDVIVAYGQNGEPVRPHQGFPLRLVVPGFEGKYHVKWLKQVRGAGPAVSDVLGAEPLHELSAPGAAQLLPGAGAEVDHHLPGRGQGAPRARVQHDQRVGVVGVRGRQPRGGVHRRRPDLEGCRDRRAGPAGGVHAVPAPVDLGRPGDGPAGAVHRRPGPGPADGGRAQRVLGPCPAAARQPDSALENHQ